MYIRGKGEEQLLVAVYVDDITVANKNLKNVRKAKQEQQEKYEMTDVGELNSLLGMQVERN